MVLISFFYVCYYNLIMAWAIFYTAASFRSTLGWSNCANESVTPSKMQYFVAKIIKMHTFCLYYIQSY